MFKEYKNSLLYQSGDLFLPQKILNFLETPIYGHHEKTTIYLTLWSIMHMISGITTELLLKYYFNIKNFQSRLIIGVIIHTIWEIWQYIIKMNKPFNLTGKNGLIDTITDTIMFLIGMVLTNYFIVNIYI
jgi:hypothetical protein